MNAKVPNAKWTGRAGAGGEERGDLRMVSSVALGGDGVLGGGRVQLLQRCAARREGGGRGLVGGLQGPQSPFSSTSLPLSPTMASQGPHGQAGPEGKGCVC